MAKKPNNNVPNPAEQPASYPEGQMPPQQPYTEGQQIPNMQELDMYGQQPYYQPMPNQMYQQPMPNQPAYQQPYTNDPLQNLLYTPPAGIYPKMDSSGRVIKYKKRGGVFAFFMGLFASLFIFIFCGGLAISYFYYCINLDDITGALGVDTSFLPVETNEKTIQQVVDLLVEYKDSYTDMTLEDLNEDFGLNIETMLYDNLGISITGLYDADITIAGVNSGHAQKIKKFRLQDIANNTDKFIKGLIPEVYKRVTLGTLLGFAQINLANFNYPIFTDALFNVTPNPTFAIGTDTYQLDFNTNKVLDSDGDELVPYVSINASNQFTLNSVTYTINSTKTTLTYGTSSSITLTYTSTMKTLEQLSIYQIINTVVPNYIGGDKLTIGFIQTAIGLNLIPDTIAEDPNYESKYGAILNTVISDLNIDDLLDSITIRTVLELTGIDIIPLNDARYNPLLDATIGTINPDDLLSQITVGAVLDLIPSLDLTSFNFINEDFRAQYLADIPTYALSLTVKELIAIPEQIYEFEHFVLTEGGIEYYINGDEISTVSKIAGSTTLPQTFIIGGTSYTIADDNLCTYTTKTNDITTSAGISTVVINGTTYQLDLINNKVLSNTGAELSPAVTITSNVFVLNDTTYTINGSNTQISYITPYTTINITTGGTNPTFVLGSTTYQLDLTNSKVLDNIGAELSPAVTITNKQFTIGNYVCTINSDNTQINYVISSATLTNNKFTIGGTEYKFDYDTLLYYVHQADITTSGDPAVQSFVLNTVTYTIDKTNGKIVQGTTNVADILSASSITEQLLYSVRNITIQDLMSGDFETVFDSLKTISIGELMGSSIPEGFDSINNLSIGAIIEDPTCLMDALESITLGAAANISETDTLLGGLANITFGQIMTDSNILVDTISDVTLASLGISSSDPLLGNLATLTIGNIMDDSTCVLTAIRGVTLSALGISGTDPLLGGIAVLTIGNIMDDPNSILNEVRSVTLGDIGMSDTDALLGDLASLTIGEIMDDPSAISNSIQSKTIGDLGITNTGMISLLTVTDDNGTPADNSDDVTYTGANIPISMVDDAFNNFDIGANTLCGLYDAGLLPSLANTVFDRSSTAYSSLTTGQQTTVQAQTFQDFFDFVVSDGALTRYIATLTV